MKNDIEPLEAAVTEFVNRLGSIRAHFRIGPPSHQMLLCPPLRDTDDPDEVYIKWGERVEKNLNIQLPGDWTTPSGRNIRKDALLSVFGKL